MLQLTLLNEHWGIAPLRNNEPSKREKRSLDFIGSGLSWCCGVATLQKLNMVENSDDEIRKRLVQDYEKLVAATFSDTELRIKSIERFTKQLENKVANTTNEQELLIMTNLYNGYLNLKRMVLLVRTLRRQAIVNSCRHHKIPAEIVNPQVLKRDLEDFESKIANSEQGLAIPTSELAAYFEMPICDCSFTKSSIYVHIKIPIIKKNRNWQLLELITTPFAWYNQTCIIRHQPLYIAVSKNGNNEGDLRQISGTGLHECKPYQNKLCYLPRFSADILQEPECAKILYQGATVKELSQYCPMDCHSATSMTISEIKDETYVITHPKQDMTISCDKRRYGQRVTVNGDRYRAMINDFLWPQLDDMDLTDIWFQQDGATCHTARATLDLLHEKFNGFIISRGGDVHWPPRSCDKTPLDFFLWGYVKSQVYADKPETIAALRANIIRVLGQVDAEMCGKVLKNWTMRMHAVQRSRGGHLNDIIFHT
ncbi:uncharacterized protein LOC126746540 [Anthonomus grandis grandis]|uniref:uncharacterized protein LOC126746540 n=1 Tax=Anthonomus grandis grandis TaxID=2921223 RepID=UPI002166B920|nr:uncharacterized protein LOC126746540 [Anthonomus grandis grandis]